MKNYELTFSILNVLIIPFSFIALKLGAPAEFAFAIYFVMTIFVQIGCLLVLKTLVEISLKEYVCELIFPMLFTALVVASTTWIINQFVEEGLMRVGIVTIVIGVISLILYYFVGLNFAEKRIVDSIILRFKNRIMR